MEPTTTRQGNLCMKGQTVDRVRHCVYSHLVIILACVMVGIGESQSKSMMLLNTTSTGPESQQTDNAQTLLHAAETETVANLHDADNDDRLTRSLFPERLMVTVTILTQSLSPDATPLTFWADGALVSMTVFVQTTGEQTFSCVLADRYGDVQTPEITETSTVRWAVPRPSIGAWHVYCESSEAYSVTVEGTSSLDLDVSLYHIDINTGVAEHVKDTPTAGRQVRAVVDIIGQDVINTVNNISLVTSDGREVGSDWLRHAGGPSDPQFETTFTWPAEPVYIRVFGQEKDGSYFERQLPYLIKPKLIDLQLRGHPTTDIVRPEEPLEIRFRLINRGQADTFLINASVDNQKFTVSVSPAQIRLGHLSSFVGRIVVGVQLSTGEATGLLEISATSTSDPSVCQSATRLLTAEESTMDRSPPSCHVMSITGNCSLVSTTPGKTCRDFDWTVRASVLDTDSGLHDVTFADVVSTENYVIKSFSQGQANEPVFVSYRASCCKEAVALDVSDMAGNEHRCEFLQLNIAPAVSPTRSPLPEHPLRSVAPGLPYSRRTSAANMAHVTFSSSRSSGSGVTRRGSGLTATSAPGVGGVLGLSPVNKSSHHGKGSTTHWEDYSTLKSVSIALGAVGGFAGLTIVIICIVYYYRYRRQRSRRDSGDSDDSDNSNDHNDHNHHHNHHHRTDHRHHQATASNDRSRRNTTPDILRSTERRENNTPL